jgi:hypothetical protein
LEVSVVSFLLVLVLDLREESSLSASVFVLAVLTLDLTEESLSSSDTNVFFLVFLDFSLSTFVIFFLVFFGEDFKALRSNTRTRRKETTLTSNDESDKSGRTVGSKRSTARKRMDDSDSQTTNSPVISGSRITKKKVTTAKQSVALQELSADR